MADPFRKFRYKVSVGSKEAGFSEVSGYDASIDVVEYREGNHVTTPRKLPGLTKYGNITLKWGATDSLDFYNWFKDCTNGTIKRETVAITAIDEKGQDIASWTVKEAWPTKYTAPDFNATASEVAIETLEIVHEGMERTK
ncbi:phage tail protein [Paenibacillus allorhizosphaerae]|uniref:Phage tail protein n=1 Tax=Paenibacillus allorhizosphaerae TaxID=2849866 RepID=A0ABM8VH63_9BACL|nr:phage tail protein [Paenibacillus allorhizosphaerae]CAG7640830.1 hypothetical protein PAECIP111802_02688 [Paenibacillus allorhizosphaerae]